MSQTIIQASETLVSDSRKTFLNLVDEHRFGKHEEALIAKLARLPESLNELFDYGMKHLPKEQSRPDQALASYFFVLSEIASLPPEVRDLAMEAMIYCENTSDVPTFSASKLRQLQKILSPKLRDLSQGTLS